MLGGDGVRRQGPNARHEVVGNEIGHVGGAGVVLTSLDKDGNAGDTQDFADPAVLRRHSSRYPKLIRNVVSDNTIHHCGYFKKNCGGVGSLSDWRKLGFDQHSLVADPRFVDVENGNYRLRAESPAFSLGFQPIPADKIGPRRRAVVPHGPAGAPE